MKPAFWKGVSCMIDGSILRKQLSLCLRPSSSHPGLELVAEDSKKIG